VVRESSLKLEEILSSSAKLSRNESEGGEEENPEKGKLLRP